ncbi:MAG: hypothetical protein R2878_13745 [Thermoleophilia bacterium]
MVAPTAILDIGSNTVRLFLNEAAAGHIPEGPRFSTVVGLRRGAAPDGSLAAESLLRLDACLADFGERAAAAGAHLGMAIGTSAVRDAPNRDAVALLVARHAGLPLTVISGAVEAELSFRGAAIAVDDTGPRLVVDVGGASTEMVQGSAAAIDGSVSLQLGSVRCTEQYLQGDPPTAGELDALRRRLSDEIGDAVVGIEARPPVIAVAGTATTIASIDLGAYSPERVHAHRLSRDRIRELTDRLAGLPLSRRERIPGLQPQRAPVIVAGAEIVVAILDAVGADALTVSERDLLDGAALLADRFATPIDRTMSAGSTEVASV